MTETSSPSTLARGARDGLYFGIFLSVAFTLMVCTDIFPIGGLVAMLMLLGAPVLLFMWMYRDTKQYPQINHFSTICLHGMIISICASMLTTVVAYLILRVARPTYIADSIQVSQQAFEQIDPQYARQFRAGVREASASGQLTAISMALAFMYYFTFLGAIGSLVSALIIKLINRKPSYEQN